MPIRRAEVPTGTRADLYMELKFLQGLEQAIPGAEVTTGTRACLYVELKFLQGLEQTYTWS